MAGVLDRRALDPACREQLRAGARLDRPAVEHVRDADVEDPIA
jgi:hypothetical protein